MDSEEVEHDSRADVERRVAPTKRRVKTKSSSEASNTLTRFLAPSGRQGSSKWEDVNLQCPVCQRKGFSSQALKFHVNECLDIATEGGSDACSTEDRVHDQSTTSAPGETTRTEGGAQVSRKASCTLSVHTGPQGKIDNADTSSMVSSPLNRTQSDQDGNQPAARSDGNAADGHLRSGRASGPDLGLKISSERRCNACSS